MFFNDNEILNKTYEELLDDCRRKRRDEVLEFIKEFEKEIKKDMTKGQIESKKMANKICAQEKNKIINHFAQFGFAVDFQEVLTEKIPVYWFNVSWKHLL